MPQIDDPRHSRLLDVHKWSDHPEVKGLVDDLWEGCLKERFEGKRGGKARRGPKPKADHKTQLRVLILDLYVAKFPCAPKSGVKLTVEPWRSIPI